MESSRGGAASIKEGLQVYNHEIAPAFADCPAGMGWTFGYLQLRIFPSRTWANWSLFNVHGSRSPLELTEADAAPAYDAEEQNNIAIYKRVLPSVSQHTPHAAGLQLLLWRGSRSRARVRLRA